MFINTFDDTEAEAFDLSYTAAPFDTGSVEVDTISDVLKQGLWEVVFTCENVTTAGSIVSIGTMVVLDPWWQHLEFIGWRDDKALINYGGFSSNDTAVGGSFGTLVSGMTWNINMRAGLPFALTLRSHFSKFRDGYTIGAVGTWLGG